MPTNITFKVTGDSSISSYTCLTNDTKFINSIITVGKNNTIKANDVQTLQNIARLSGDANVIEESDIKAIKNMQTDAANGNATYDKSWFTSSWDEIFIKLPAGTTMKEVKERYNLPDGSLKNYLIGASSHGIETWDDYEVEDLGKGYGQVWFNAKVYAEANGLTLEQVKAMFKK